MAIATDLAERNGRFAKPDRSNFLPSRGSAQDCVLLLEVAPLSGFVKDVTALTLKDRLGNIGRMISGQINGLDMQDGCLACGFVCLLATTRSRASVSVSGNPPAAE